MSPQVRVSRILLVVAAGAALVFCRPPPKDTNQPDTSNPDTEFSDETEFSTPSGDSRSATDQSLPYEPCRDKRCGTPCTVCDPHDDSCVELQLIHNCTLTGQCVVAPVDCTPPKPAKGKDAKKKK